MPQCNHCHKKFKIGHGKGSLTTHLAAVEAANTKKLNSKSGKGKTNTGSKKKNKKRIADRPLRSLPRADRRAARARSRVSLLLFAGRARRHARQADGSR